MESLPLGRWTLVLFDYETSARRALIQALGTYDVEQLLPAEQKRLIDKLVTFFRDDPDAGIHGAAEWTLRQWKRKDQIKKSVKC